MGPVITVGGHAFSMDVFHSCGVTDANEEFAIRLLLKGAYSSDNSENIVTADQRVGQKKAFSNDLREVRLMAKDPVDTLEWYLGLLTDLGVSEDLVGCQKDLILKNMNLWVPIKEGETANEDRVDVPTDGGKEQL